MGEIRRLPISGGVNEYVAEGLAQGLAFRGRLKGRKPNTDPLVDKQQLQDWEMCEVKKFDDEELEMRVSVT